MAYTEDATVSNNYNSAGSNFLYTVNSLLERLLVVRFNLDSASVVTCTYNGVALTFIGRVVNASFGATEFWALKMPATGSNSLVWTLSGVDKHVVAATGMSGINQTVSWRNFTAATGNGTAPTVTVTGTTVEHKVFDSVAIQEGATSVVVTVGPGQTQQYQNRTTGAPSLSNVVGAGSVEDGGAVSTTMSWTLSLTRQWAIAAIEILPVVEGECDLVGIGLMSPDASFVASGKVSFAGVGTMSVTGGRVRLLNLSFTGTAAMTCFPEFPQGDVNLPVEIPQQFFFISTDKEFLLRWILQELNRPKRVDLGHFERVILKVDGFADKECTIEDANDGVAYYITSPAEFPVGQYKGHLTLVLDGLFDSSVDREPESTSDDVYEVEVDTPEFIIFVNAPPA